MSLLNETNNNYTNQTLNSTGCNYRFNDQANDLNGVLKFLDILQHFVLISGSILNILNIVVLLNSKLNDSPYTYLTTLAFSDLFTLLSRLTFPFIRKFIYYLKLKSLISIFNQYIDITFNNLFISCSMYITLALTIERFIFVTSPFKAVSICQKSKARKVCICVILFSMVKTAYLPFVYQRVEHQCLQNNGMPVEIYEQRKNTILDIAQFLIDLAIPYFTIFIINIALIRSLKKKYIHINSSMSFDTHTHMKLKQFMIPKSKSDYNIVNENRRKTVTVSTLEAATTSTNRPVRRNFSCQLQDNDASYRRTSNEKEAKTQRKLTRSLITILCCLLICHLPNFLLEESIINGIFGDHNDQKIAYHLKQTGWRISIILIYINCSANFVIYCISNRKFYSSSIILLNKWKHKLEECYSKCCCAKSKEDEKEDSRTSNYMNKNRSQSTSNIHRPSFKPAYTLQVPVFKTPIERLQKFN